MEGRVITKEDEDALRKEYWKDVPLLKYQLYSALEAFTDGEAKKEVRFNDEANVFTTWSRLSDKGHSRRTRNVADMQRKAYATRSVVAAKDLESAILEYEKDVMQLKRPAGRELTLTRGSSSSQICFLQHCVNASRTSQTSSRPTTTPGRRR